MIVLLLFCYSSFNSFMAFPPSLPHIHINNGNNGTMSGLYSQACMDFP